MSNPELSRQNLQIQEMDPAMRQLYAELAQKAAQGPAVQEITPIIPDAATQAEQKVHDIADKRHLVEDAFAAVEKVHVPTGEKLILDGKTKSANTPTLIEQAVDSQPVPDSATQGRKKLLHKMGSHVHDRVKKLGLKSKISGRQAEQDALMRLRAGSETDLAAQAGGTKELDVTAASRQDWVEDKVVGEELIRGLATPQRMTTEMRQKMFELWKENPDQAKRIWQGVEYYQATGNISRNTAHETGKATEKLAA